ncbi:MAG: isoprenylcysteine carboxylmethyltransferase family protein, partial [Thiotrichales bacterium]|nr:isoprenylcysteine carboxylmethyltransferase family protein [Thiotrichales bacterium]
IGLGLWAVATMHLGRFNIVPDPMPDAQLVLKGPYRWIRHPMYSSLLTFFFPIAVQSQNPITWLCYGLLLIDLLLKLHYEERLLIQTFANYPDYQTKSKKLIPYLF